ncbi:MAG: tetratricopeptide repeat protein [Polyangiaceae bacterium]
MGWVQSTRIFTGLAVLAGALSFAGPARADAAGDAEAALAKGRAERRAGATKEATADLRRAVSLSAPKSEVALRATYELARLGIDRREFGQAMAQCRILQQKAGGEALGHACAAEAYLLWRRASEATTEIKKALAKNPRLYEAKVAEGRARLLELRDAEAEAALKEAVAIDPRATDAYLALADVHALFGKTDAAIVDLREVLKLDERSPEASYLLARLLPPSTETVGLLETALRERPAFGEALARLAEVEIALGHLDRARAAAQRALATDPEGASMRVVVGRVALAEGKLDAALSEAKAALSSIPNLASGKLLLADAYAKQGEIDLAVEAYTAAFGFDHFDPTPLVRASEACRAQGRETSAKAFADKATREFPNWGPAWIALGDVLVAQKDASGAKQAYEQALVKARGIDGANEARKRLERLK